MGTRDKRLLTKQLLLSDSYWALNKSMVNLLGLETAFLLSNFAEAESMLADSDGWFYQTAGTVEKITTLSRHKQDQCIKELENKGILKKDVRGVPPKRYFKINYECLTNQFVKSQQINMRNSSKSICQKSATNKEHIYKEHNINNVIDSNAIKFYQDNFGMISPHIADCINNMSKELSEDMTIKAMQIALENNVRKIRYVESIVYDWAKNNIRTPDDLKAHELSRKQGTYDKSTSRVPSASDTMEMLEDMYGGGD